MIEGEAPDNTWPLLAAGEGAAAPTEEVVAQGLERAKEVIAEVIEFQEEFLAAVGVKPSDFEPHPSVSARSLGRPRVLREGQGPDRARARPERARGQHVRRQGRGEGSSGADAGGGRVREARQRVLARMEVAREEGHARARDLRRRPAGRPRGEGHPSALRTRRALAPCTRVVAVRAGRHPGAQRHDARDAPDEPDDRHARSRGLEAVHPPLQLPAVLDR